jgi:ATP/maltotriose-dependent transcriptional regulator MalT/DNA-binding SARP family transcriptional activator
MSRLAQPLAKLSRPRLHDVVLRERLFGLLDGLHQQPVTWVVGPPGAGKTTVVASWLEARKLHGIWYQVDPGDADPATFFYYLGLAGRPWQRKRPPLPLLTPEYLADVPGFARRFFRQLFAWLGSGQTLVLDNLHELPDGACLLPALAAAAEEVPGGARLIVISRDGPGVAFARLAANRALSVVGPEQLLLTPAETGALAATRIEVDGDRAQQLHRLSAGWAAGLALIVERIRRGLTGGSVGEPESYQEVFDYFASEIHDRADPENRQILLGLCLFPRFTADQAVSVSGNAHAARLLDYLYRRHLFVERRASTSASDQVYQFHALFQAFLRRQAAATFAPSEMQALARTTAASLEARGNLDEAVPLYFEAEDWQSVAQAIRRNGDTYLRQGRRQLLSDWLQRLPAEVSEADPCLQYWAGVTRAALDPAGARPVLERAHRGAVRSGDRLCQAQCAAAVVETIFLEYTQFDALDQWIPVLEAAVEAELPFPVGTVELQLHAALIGAIVHRKGNPPGLARHVTRLAELLLAGEAEINLWVNGATHLMRYATSVGDLDLVERVLALAQPRLDHPALTPHARGLCELFVGWGYVTLLDDQRAQASAQRLELIAKEYSLPQLCRFAAIIGWWVEVLRQRPGDAQRWLSVMTQVSDPQRRYDAAQLASMRAWQALTTGDPQAGLQAARAAVELHDRLGSSWHRLFARGLLTWACVECGNPALAQQTIEDVRALAAQYNLSAYDTYAPQAEATMALRQGDAAALRDRLVKLFSGASEHGVGMPTRFFPSWMPRLCAEALAEGIEVAYVRQLIRRFGWSCPSVPIEQWPWTVRIYALGRFAVYVDDAPLAFPGRAPKKMLNLLKALICMGGSEVRDYRLVDALWPDDEADAARAAFSVTLHRLRRLLGNPDAIVVQDGSVTLNPQVCWVDAFAFERLSELRTGKPGDSRRGDAALDLYRGNLLPGEVEEPWSTSLRERLKVRFVREVRAAAEQHEQAGELERAIALYSRGLEADDLTEAFYQGLMRCHLALGAAADAAGAYRRMRQLFAAILGIKPSPESERLHALAVGGGRSEASPTARVMR